jgi:hypothetical protein
VLVVQGVLMRHGGSGMKTCGVKFRVHTAMNMKMAVFWDVKPYSPIDIDRRFGGTYCLHHQGDEYIDSKLLKNASLHGVTSQQTDIFVTFVTFDDSGHLISPVHAESSWAYLQRSMLIQNTQF